MNQPLRDKLKTLPIEPGVYFHKSATGEVIYVGKAAMLRSRVRQYFQSNKDFDIKTRALVDEIADTDWITTESEIDALFLESEMVKRYKPRYNILLRDDKSQTYVRINMRDDWPHVSFTRNPADDGADYYGPYYNGYAVKKALRHLRRVFPYYIKPPSETNTSRLEEQIGLNPPRDWTSRDYRANLRRLIRYIQGGRIDLTRDLERQMQVAAGQQQFELAAELRNKLRHLGELQRKIMFGDREFLDISKDKALRDLARILGLPKPPRRIEGYDISHISGTNVVASMVVFTNGASDRAEYRKFKMVEQRNDDAGAMRATLMRRMSPRNLASWGVPDLVLIDGGRTQLDAAGEAMSERGQRIPTISIAKREEEVLISKQHSHCDISALRALMADMPPGVMITESAGYFTLNLHAGQLNAGSHSRNLRAAHAPSPYDDITKLFQRIRDESHRFAVSYHTALRRTNQTRSALDDIPGVGPVTRRKLVKSLGSVRAVRTATLEQLTAVVGVQKAAIIHSHFSRT